MLYSFYLAACRIFPESFFCYFVFQGGSGCHNASVRVNAHQYFFLLAGAR